RKVKDINSELSLMKGYNVYVNKEFVNSLSSLLKIPQWVKRLEQLDKVARVFNVPHNPEDDWLLQSINFLKDESTELRRINKLFISLDEELSSHFNNDCWEFIKELSDAEDFVKFLNDIASDEVANLINGADDHSDEKLIQEDTVSSL